MMAEYRHVSARTVSGILVVTIRDRELRTAEVCHAVRDELGAAVTHAGAHQLILDLSDVQFLGSIGMLVFLGARRLPQMGRIVLCHLSPHLREVFLLCRLLSEAPGSAGPFEQAATVEEAVALLA
jgi:anti-anti-sigma factor